MARPITDCIALPVLRTLYALTFGAQPTAHVLQDASL